MASETASALRENEKDGATGGIQSRVAVMKLRAAAIGKAGGLAEALAQGTLPSHITTTLSEALVLGLLKQGVRKYLAIFGHGSTDLGEVLRVYQEAGVTRTFNFRNEVAMAHAATTLRWQYGETSAVVTSIGPGALQAMAGSLASASNGVGVYHIYGDETTHGEGYNMQQIPKPEQDLFGRVTALMGESYVLHTPGAVREALRRGSLRVNHPYKAGPFYLLLPLNTQPQEIDVLNLASLPEAVRVAPLRMEAPEAVEGALEALQGHHRVIIKAGGGAREFPGEVRALAEATGAAVVLSPGALGVLPDAHPQNMHVGGSKGSISGNHAMGQGDLLIAIGTRAVCQADCSGIGYPGVKTVINFNGDFTDLNHYAHTLAFPGDIGASLRLLLEKLRAAPLDLAPRQEWLAQCLEKKQEWGAFKAERYAAPPLQDEVWGRPVLTQPTAIKVAADFAKGVEAVKYFDAGDVQANGFQVVEDDHPGQTYTETGASYMGFSPSALVAGGLAEKPVFGMAFVGDGSFMMNPQVLIDAVEHGARGMVVIFDNRRMAAITGLQEAQYGQGFRTNDRVAVDYVKMAQAVEGVLGLYGGETVEALKAALEQGYRHQGLSVVHVPVYSGPSPLGGMGAYGDWNVGNWVADVQRRYHEQDL